MKKAVAMVMVMAMLVAAPASYWADEKAAIEVMESYLDFVVYGGATLFPEQIPAEE